MNHKYCYWSIGDGRHADMLEAAVYSMKQVGITENIHVWSDRPIANAITHDIESPDKDNYLFKLHILANDVSKLLYDYYVFFDADSWFLRNPGDPTQLCSTGPLHVSLESDCADDGAIRDNWWDVPLDTYVQLMRDKGVRPKAVYNCNAGFFVVHRKAVAHFYRLCMEFWNYANDKGHVFTEEAPMAYASHMMMGDPYLHTLKNTASIWASDWMGHFEGRIPVDEPWPFYDYMTHKPFTVQPAIVHCMRSKEALIAHGTTPEKILKQLA